MNFIKPIRIIAYILTAMFVISAIWYGLDYKNDKINNLQATVNILWNYKLNEPALKDRIANLEAENIQLKKLNEELTITNTANSMTINTFKSDYLTAISYITVAECILNKQGIEFLYTGRR